MLGQPMSSGGEFPVSLAFNSAGDRLCVLNGGEVNGVKCFAVDGKTGLTGIPNTVRSLGLNLTTPAAGPAGTVSHILFNADGSQLLASVKGTPPQPGFVAVWDVAQNGSLSAQFKAVPPPSGGVLPFGMNLIPGKNAVFVTDPAVGVEVISPAGATKNATAVSVPGQGAICWTSYSAKTGSFYITDVIRSLVTEVGVSGNLSSSIVKVMSSAPLYTHAF
jgi:hypothetical protein